MPDLEEPALQDYKNVSLAPVDVGGRVLAVGEIATLSPHHHAVHEAVSTGALLAVATFIEPPAENTKPARKGSAKTAPKES